MRFVHCTAIVAAAGLLAGCVSAPRIADSSTPWTPPERAKKPGDTWKALRDLRIDTSAPFTLAELTDLALQNHPATRKAWNDARAAAAQVEQARGYFMPTLVGTLGATQQRVDADPEGYDTDHVKYGPGLQINYLVINFGGGRKAAVEAALETVYALDFTFNRTLQDVLLAVETAYYGLITAQAGVEAAGASAKDAATALDAAREAKTAGIGTQLDVLQAQAASDQALYNLANAQGQLRIARAGLAQAVGLPADTDIQATPPQSEVAASLPERDMRTLIDEALQARPDIAALRAILAAKLAIVKVTGAAEWPSLYINGSLSHDNYDTHGDGEMQDRDWAYSAGINLQWTLFDGLQTINAKRAAAAEAESARAQLQQAELAASADVWVRYTSYDTALQKYRFSTAYLDSASASYDLALSSYKAGLRSILDLLNAESQLATARSLQIATRQEAFVALANLAHATGMLGLEQAGGMQDLFSTSTGKDEQP